jgi:serine/threonine-protein kinase
MNVGSRLGSYEIVSLLGAGGMGEVYRARDTKLDRDVALKVLPDSFVHDPDRLARFQREAKVLAALNHPNIAHIHGLEESNGVQALVMELVDGEDLAQRLTRGAIPIDEALPIARQIAEALEAAHEQGIVHRDLKPANIKVRTDGTVKVLDFGLAKALEPTGAMSSSVSMSPTITSPAMTQVGIILGTAAYMSPQQAKGRPADKRGDIWAFGCVLYEMLTGQRVFGGEDVSDTFAYILTREPDWTALPADTPLRIRKLLRGCLQKDLRKRLPHIGVARLEIDDGETDDSASSIPPAVPTTAARSSLWRRAIPAAVASVVVGMLVATAAWTVRPRVATTPIARFFIPVPEEMVFTTTTRHMLSISPDGTQVAYVANARLYLRAISDLDAKAIPDSDLNGSVYDPVFSPDGRSIAFWSGSDGAIKKISVGGGPAITLCPAAVPWGLSWGNDGITFGQGAQGVMRVSENGGKPETLAQVKNAEVADGPQTIAGGTSVLFTVAPASPTAPATIDQFDKAQIVVQAVGSSERRVLVDGGADARYVSTGHLVYAQGGVLFSVPFDARRLEVTGGAVPILEGVRRSAQTGAAQFSVSSTGTLVYVPGPSGSAAAQSQLAVFDRTTGAATSLRLPPAAVEHARISPEGKRITYDVETGKDANVFVYDLEGTNAARPLTFSGKNKFPIWSGDGQWIVFQSDREGDLGLFRQRVDGTGNPERLTKPEAGVSHIPEAWVPKTDAFLYSESAKTFTLWTFSIPDRKPARVDDVESTIPLNAVISPDGRWVAYTSGENQLIGGIYVRSLPPTETKYRVTQGQGLQALWSPDGKWIYYNPAPGQYVRVSFSTSPSFSIGNAEPVPRPFVTGGPNTIRNNDMTPDGKILGIAGSGQTASGVPVAQRLIVVLNWFEELRARLRTH